MKSVISFFRSWTKYESSCSQVCVFAGPHLRDHFADGRPNGRFHSTPCSCTLVLMSSASVSDCSMEDQGENRDERDEDGNMVPGGAEPSLKQNKKKNPDGSLNR